MIIFLFIQADHGMGILWHVFPLNTKFSMRLPDSASIFTAEIWAIITALEEIKKHLHPNASTIQKCGFQLVEGPLYSPDLAASDYYLFPKAYVCMNVCVCVCVC